jgi:hypothetical protein
MHLAVIGEEEEDECDTPQMCLINLLFSLALFISHFSRIIRILQANPFLNHAHCLLSNCLARLTGNGFLLLLFFFGEYYNSGIIYTRGVGREPHFEFV